MCCNSHEAGLVLLALPVRTGAISGKNEFAAPRAEWPHLLHRAFLERITIQQLDSLSSPCAVEPELKAHLIQIGKKHQWMLIKISRELAPQQDAIATQVWELQPFIQPMVQILRLENSWREVEGTLVCKIQLELKRWLGQHSDAGEDLALLYRDVLGDPVLHTKENH